MRLKKRDGRENKKERKKNVSLKRKSFVRRNNVSYIYGKYSERYVLRKNELYYRL